ncbi:hypothetical protein HID58_079158 [Brassica napus]|uniref:Uncharacterized protein n=1 Tax=Brassica napus TaxID=3708 RepID=A0ABQ7Y182_BRANA|nr:hypothetical protein HID58_079158 [Brassica napus]
MMVLAQLQSPRPNPKTTRTHKLQTAHGSRTLDTCKDNAPSVRHASLPHQPDLHHLEKSPEIHHRKRGAQTTAEPPSRPTLLFHTLFSLWRASSIQSKAHPTTQSRESLGITNQETPTYDQRNPQPNQKTGTRNRRRKVEETFTPWRTEPRTGELQKPPLPETRTGGDGAEGAFISRKRNIH